MAAGSSLAKAKIEDKPITLLDNTGNCSFYLGFFFFPKSCIHGGRSEKRKGRSNVLDFDA